jgi:hypothetical protein
MHSSMRRGDGGWIVASGSIRPDGRVWRSTASSLIEAYQANTIPELPTWIVVQIQSSNVMPDDKKKAKREAAATTLPTKL